MKKFILIGAAILTLASCSKQELAPKQPLETIVKTPVKIPKMNGFEFKAKFGFELPGVDYSATAAKGKKNSAALVVINVWQTDLTLSLTSGILTTSISPNAQWAAIQKYVSQTINDGAYCPTGCNWNFNVAPGPGIERSCNYDGVGEYRSFTSDFPFTDGNGDINYTIHVSDFHTF